MFNRDKINISICMATYNGTKYIKEQINSILPQLMNGDELIVVDDNSTDGTADIIRSYQSKYIKLIINPHNIGHVRTFEKAISQAKNDYIFLSDQDDIWIPHRVDQMLKKLKSSDCYVLATNYTSFKDDDGKRTYLNRPISNNVHGSRLLQMIKEIMGFRINSRLGCCIVFTSTLKEILLPFPKNVTQHDIWICICGTLLNKYLYFDKITLLHRIHDNNVSAKRTRPLYKVLLNRLNRVIYCLIILKRILSEYGIRLRFSNIKI